MQLLCQGLASQWRYLISHDSDSSVVIKTAIFETWQRWKWLYKNQHRGPRVWQKAIDQGSGVLSPWHPLLLCCVVLHTNAALLYNLTNIKVVLSPVFVWRQNYWDTAAWRGKQYRNDLTETRNNLVNFTVWCNINVTI